MDRLTIKQNVAIESGYSYNVSRFKEKEELCDIVFRFLNKHQYNIVYLNKKVDYKNNNSFAIIEEGIYKDPYGDFSLKIVADKEYLSLVKAFLREFKYEKQREDKKGKSLALKPLDNR